MYGRINKSFYSELSLTVSIRCMIQQPISNRGTSSLVIIRLSKTSTSWIDITIVALYVLFSFFHDRPVLLSCPPENRRCNLNTSALLTESFLVVTSVIFSFLFGVFLRDYDTKLKICQISSRSNDDVFL